MTTHAISSTTAASEHGESSALVVQLGQYLSAEEAQQIAEQLALEFVPHLIRADLPSLHDVEAYASDLHQYLHSIRVKKGTLLAVGKGCAIAQAFAVQFPKFCRRLVLINPTARLAPSFFTRGIDRLERWLPLGLPLRPLSANYDSRPQLHRVRCPTLIVTERTASSFEQAQSQLIARRIPNAWFTQVNGALSSDLKFSGELIEMLQVFLQVPTKRPQKGVSGEGRPDNIRAVSSD